MKVSSIILFLLFNTVLMSQNTIQPTVSVIGEGIIQVVPDEVTINVQVENKGNNPKELKNKNDVIVNDVLQFIKKMNINVKDVQTQYVRLHKNYDYQTKTYHFIANQSIVIKLKDLSKYESLMNGLLESGINRIDGISFSASNQDKLKSEARKKAMLDAKTKAEEYAGVLTQKIGKALIISEFSQNTAPSPVYKEASLRMSADSAGMGQQTISAGVIEIRTVINVTFLLN